jgi:hypothetical protein
MPQRQLTRLVVVTLEHRILNSVILSYNWARCFERRLSSDIRIVVVSLSMSWNNMNVMAGSVNQERTSLNSNGIERKPDGESNLGLVNSGIAG